MMTAATLGAWLVFANAISMTLIVLALGKIQDRVLKYHFVSVIAAGLLYINPLLLFWLPDISPDTRLLLSRFVFTAGLLVPQTFAFFTIRFCRMTDEFRSWRFFIFEISSILLIGLVWSGFIPEGIRQNGTEYVLVHGWAQPCLVVSVAVYPLYLGFLAWRGYRNSQEEVLQYQIKFLMGAGVLTAISMVITNVLVPFFSHRSILTPIFVVEATMFWSGALYILVRGELLILRHDFANLIGREAFVNHETLAALRSYIYAFDTSLDVDRPIEEKLSFFTEDRKPVRLRVTNLNDSQSLTGESVPLGWYEGQIEELQKLRSENFRLLIAVEKGRRILQSVSTQVPQLEHLVDQGLQGGPSELQSEGEFPEHLRDLTPLEIAERRTILEYLKKNNYNQSRTSKEIGIRPNTMIVKMRKYGIAVPAGLTRPGRKPKS